ncbi:MAG: response regulator, partial [Deltaproteobacteria bacterium]|nr:response regulator [Deltaproteobacteria bacterium]
FQTGEAASYETMVEVAPNRVLWYSTRVSAVRSVNERQAGGEIIESVILITTDITSQKQNEEARERLHTRLVKSQKMEALGRLSAGIAHKFNNTMAGISALAENCQVELEEAGAGREFGTGAFGILEGLEKIQRQITISKETVSQLLLFSQGASDDTKKERNLVEELKESASMVRALLPPHIKVAEHFNVGQVRLKVNHMQIQQMILLLAMNARDAIQGHGTLNLGLELMDMESITCQSCGEEARGPFAEICVCDSGLGMGEETLARIFEPFFSTREPGQGTGLGMSIVHGIVHDHGGHITVKSTPGQGTTVKIYLPCEASGKAEQSKGQTMPCGVSSSHRIMFVDDDELITEQMDKYLTHRGYRVTALSDPLEALNMMQQPGERFSLLITDHFMPEMTGMELVAKLRKGGLRLPVIICTGNPVDITDDWREAGISELFIKPFRFSRLVEVIEQHLADSESGCC